MLPLLCRSKPDRRGRFLVRNGASTGACLALFSPRKGAWQRTGSAFKEPGSGARFRLGAQGRGWSRVPPQTIFGPETCRAPRGVGSQNRLRRHVRSRPSLPTLEVTLSCQDTRRARAAARAWLSFCPTKRCLATHGKGVQRIGFSGAPLNLVSGSVRASASTAAIREANCCGFSVRWLCDGANS